MLVGLEFNQYTSSIIASCYNEEGRLKYITKRVGDDDKFVWKSSSEDRGYRAWDDKFVRKQKQSYINSRIRMEELVIQLFKKDELMELYTSDRKPEVFFLDIEVETNENNDFPEPEEALFPVNLITLMNKDQIICLTTLEAFTAEQQEKMVNEMHAYFSKYGINEKFKLHIKYFPKEKEMLEYFFHKALPIIPLITGWNVIEFDWLYLVNRAQSFDINITLKLKSNRIVGKMKIPIHLGILDYMEIVKEFRAVKMAENHTLDYISHVLLGVNKLPNPYASFFEFQQDHYTFALYNVIDTVLVHLIDKKKDLLKIAYEMASIAQCELSKIFSPVAKTELFMCREFLSRGKYMPDIDNVPKDAKYPGAYVMEPVTDHYDLIGCFDFASQYPNVTMQWNISPDTYIGKRSRIDMSKYPANAVVVTKNDTVFWNDRDSATRVILRNYYDQRKAYKNEMTRLEAVLAERTKKKINIS